MDLKTFPCTQSRFYIHLFNESIINFICLHRRWPKNHFRRFPLLGWQINSIPWAIRRKDTNLVAKEKRFPFLNVISIGRFFINKYSSLYEFRTQILMTPLNSSYPITHIYMLHLHIFLMTIHILFGMYFFYHKFRMMMILAPASRAYLQWCILAPYINTTIGVWKYGKLDHERA